MTGYESKKAMAQDKITDEQGRPMTYWGGKAQPAQEPVVGTKTWFEDGKVVTQYLTAKDIYKEPEQEPAIGDIRALKHRIHELEGEVIGYKRILDAQPAQEQNFCPRCGKRTPDLTTIHTCTPPQENT